MANFYCLVEVEALVEIEVEAESAEQAASQAALEVGRTDPSDLDFEPGSLRVGCLARYPQEL